MLMTKAEKNHMIYLATWNIQRVFRVYAVKELVNALKKLQNYGSCHSGDQIARKQCKRYWRICCMLQYQ